MNVLKKVPQSRFLVETDSPFLSPVPHRGKRNEPSFVKHVVDKISEIRGESFSEIAEKKHSKRKGIVCVALNIIISSS